MIKLEPDVVQFFHRQNYVIVSSLDERGVPYCACKGVILVEPEGRLFLLDLYKARTFGNILRNPAIAVTAVDEHAFKGYCIRGKAFVLSGSELTPDLINLWDEKITVRITQRVVRNIKESPGHTHHPEAMLPHPEYIVMMEAEDVIDLTPPNLRTGAPRHK